MTPADAVARLDEIRKTFSVTIATQQYGVGYLVKQVLDLEEQLFATVMEDQPFVSFEEMVAAIDRECTAYRAMRQGDQAA